MGAYDDEFERFCQAEHPRLVGTLTLYTGDADLAPELAQEALARACRDWSSVAALDSPGGWVHRVAMNLAKSTFRRHAVERRHRRASGSPPAHESHDLAAAVALREAVAQLPHRQRSAIILRYWVDLSVEETAHAMGCATGTVKALTHQAIERLRRAGLAPSDADPDDESHQEVNDVDATTP